MITSGPLAEMPLSFAGYAGEVHAGVTRPVVQPGEKAVPGGHRNPQCAPVMRASRRGNGRDCRRTWGLRRLTTPGCGASLVLEGIPDLTHLPPSSRLQGPDGVTLVVDMENLPCQEPAVTIEKALPGQGKGFKRGRRGQARRHRLGRARGGPAAGRRGAAAHPGAAGLDAAGRDAAGKIDLRSVKISPSAVPWFRIGNAALANFAGFRSQTAFGKRRWPGITSQMEQLPA